MTSLAITAAGFAASVSVLLLVFAAPALVSADEQLSVLQPAKLAKELNGPITDVGTALFGAYPYGGGRISGPAYYPADNTDGCKRYDADSIGPVPGIVLVDQGNCTFAAKVLHAQRAGALAVVVVDKSRVWTRRYMGNDNTLASDISIPSLLISNDNGRLIVDAVQNMADNESVTLSMSFDMKDKRNEVALEIYEDSLTDERLIGFVKDLSTVAEMMSKEKSVSMKLILEISARTEWFEDDDCIDDWCISHWTMYPFVHKAKLLEMLRQLCIVDHDWIQWWRYYPHFVEECIKEGVLDDECWRRSAKAAGINIGTVEACVSDQQDAHRGNYSLFAASAEAFHSANFRMIPQMIVNSALYKNGDYQCPSPVDRSTCGPLSFICSGYENPPQFCLSKNTCRSGQMVDACGTCRGVYDKDRIDDPSKCPDPDVVQDPPFTGLSVTSFIFIAVLFSVVLAAIMVVYIKHSQRQNRRFLADRMSQYVSIDDTSIPSSL